MIEIIILAIILGCFIGIMTGLIPGIHINLVSAILVSISASLMAFAKPELLIAFLVSMAITHTFLDTIPSIFLGAPDGATALSILPGHKLLLEGKGLEAVKLTIIGSLFGLLFALTSYVLLEAIISTIYPIINPHIAEILIVAGAFMILSSKKKGLTGLVFVFSGLLGLMVLRSRMDNALFPLLSGFFGVSTLMFSLKSKNNIPKQIQSKETKVSNVEGGKSILLGTLSGFFTAFLPGLGASTAAAISSLFRKDNDSRNFLVMIGAISTVNFFMSIAALNVLGKARNGAIIAVMSISEQPSTLMLLGTSAISAGIAVFLAITIAKKFSVLITKIKYEIVAKTVILLIVIVAFLLCSFTGIIILVVASTIGYYANLKGIPRNSMMACILVPVMLFFLI